MFAQFNFVQIGDRLFLHAAVGDSLGGVELDGNLVRPADAGHGNVRDSREGEIAIPELLSHLPNIDRVNIHREYSAGAFRAEDGCVPRATLPRGLHSR